MELETRNVELETKALEMQRRLTERYGFKPNVPRRDPMHELVSTILSQRTTGRNESEAYHRMRKRFPSWEAVRDAPELDLEDAIAPANYPEIKAPRIKEVVRRILAERGSADLEFLRTLPLDQAMAWLTALPGVGPKTATLVLLFCFARPVLPVDTHVHRVSQRVGLIGPKIDATAAHPILLALLPPDPTVLYNFHINTLLHGQQVCVWKAPRCSRCPLTDMCDWYREHRAGSAAREASAP